MTLQGRSAGPTRAVPRSRKSDRATLKALIPPTRGTASHAPGTASGAPSAAEVTDVANAVYEQADAIIVDFHTEATSEIQGMGFFMDGLEAEAYDRSYNDRELIGRIGEAGEKASGDRPEASGDRPQERAKDEPEEKVDLTALGKQE